MADPRPDQNQRHLDAADLKLIDLLDADPRITYTNAAARLGVGRATAKAMVERLNKKGVRIVCYVDERVRGYGSTVVFCINTDPAGLFEVASGLAAMEEIQSVMLFTGPFDIVAIAVFKAQYDIARFVSEKLGKLRGIVRQESLIFHEIKPGHPAPPDAQRADSDGDGVFLDDLDIGLIRELQKNARESATTLATILGTTRTTVVRRLNKLIEGKALAFQTIWGSYARGDRGLALIGLRVSPSSIKDVGWALARYYRVRSVLLCNGRYDVIAWVVFEKQEDLIDFLDGELGKIPGIAGIESSIALKLIKYDLGPAAINDRVLERRSQGMR